jgi:plasmid stabilization system protein ParE
MLVIRRPKFIDDLCEAFAFLSDRNPAAAERLLEEVEVVVELLGAFPGIGRPRDELRAGVRSFKLRSFPHLIFYRMADEAVVLLRFGPRCTQHRVANGCG